MSEGKEVKLTFDNGNTLTVNFDKKATLEERIAKAIALRDQGDYGDSRLILTEVKKDVETITPLMLPDVFKFDRDEQIRFNKDFLYILKTEGAVNYVDIQLKACDIAEKHGDSSTDTFLKHMSTEDFLDFFIHSEKPFEEQIGPLLAKDKKSAFTLVCNSARTHDNPEELINKVIDKLEPYPEELSNMYYNVYYFRCNSTVNDVLVEVNDKLSPLLDLSLKYNPNNCNALMYKAQEFRLKGDGRKYDELMEKAYRLDKNPTEFSAQFTLDYLFRRNRFEEVLDLYTKIVKPEDADRNSKLFSAFNSSIENLVGINFFNKEYDKAIKYFELGEKYNCEGRGLELAGAYSYFDTKNFQRANEILRKARRFGVFSLSYVVSKLKKQFPMIKDLDLESERKVIDIMDKSSQELKKNPEFIKNAEKHLRPKYSDQEIDVEARNQSEFSNVVVDLFKLPNFSVFSQYNFRTSVHSFLDSNFYYKILFSSEIKSKGYKDVDPDITEEYNLSLVRKGNKFYSLLCKFYDKFDFWPDELRLKRTLLDGNFVFEDSELKKLLDSGFLNQTLAFLNNPPEEGSGLHTDFVNCYNMQMKTLQELECLIHGEFLPFYKSGILKEYKNTVFENYIDNFILLMEEDEQLKSVAPGLTKQLAVRGHCFSAAKISEKNEEVRHLFTGILNSAPNSDLIKILDSTEEWKGRDSILFRMVYKSILDEEIWKSLSVLRRVDDKRREKLVEALGDFVLMKGDLNFAMESYHLANTPASKQKLERIGDSINFIVTKEDLADEKKYHKKILVDPPRFNEDYRLALFSNFYANTPKAQKRLKEMSKRFFELGHYPLAYLAISNLKDSEATFRKIEIAEKVDELKHPDLNETLSLLLISQDLYEDANDLSNHLSTKERKKLREFTGEVKMNISNIHLVNQKYAAVNLFLPLLQDTTLRKNILDLLGTGLDKDSLENGMIKFNALAQHADSSMERTVRTAYDTMIAREDIMKNSDLATKIGLDYFRFLNKIDSKTTIEDVDKYSRQKVIDSILSDPMKALKEIYNYVSQTDSSALEVETVEIGEGKTSEKVEQIKMILEEIQLNLILKAETKPSKSLIFKKYNSEVLTPHLIEKNVVERYSQHNLNNLHGWKITAGANITIQDDISVPKFIKLQDIGKARIFIYEQAKGKPLSELKDIDENLYNLVIHDTFRIHETLPDMLTDKEKQYLLRRQFSTKENNSDYYSGLVEFKLKEKGINSKELITELSENLDYDKLREFMVLAKDMNSGNLLYSKELQLLSNIDFNYITMTLPHEDWVRFVDSPGITNGNRDDIIERFVYGLDNYSGPSISLNNLKKEGKDFNRKLFHKMGACKNFCLSLGVYFPEKERSRHHYERAHESARKLGMTGFLNGMDKNIEQLVF